MKGVGRSIAKRRMMARGIDLVICVALFALPRVGPILGVCAALGLDALPGGSPGKRLMHLEVLRSDLTPVTLGASVVRNLPVALTMLLASVDGFLGWLAATALAVVTVAFEGSLVFSDPRGQRAFDILGATLVRHKDDSPLPPNPTQDSEGDEELGPDA